MIRHPGLLIAHVKCAVFDCENCTGEGVFIGDFCAPCHEMITNRPLRKIVKLHHELEKFWRDEK